MVKLYDSFRTALNGLRANRGRSALATLGVVIGIAAVIAVVSIGEGAQNLILGQIATLGSNNIFIEPGSWSGRMEGGSMMQSMMEEAEIRTLKYEDALAIAKLPSVEMAAPFVLGTSRAIYQNDSKKITFMGSTAEASGITNTDVILGQNITEQDVKARATVAVLGYKTKEDLFGEEDPIGKTIRIQKINFKVIGVLEERGAQVFMNLDENIYLPITTVQKLLLGVDHVRWIIVKAKDEESIDQAVSDIRLLLRERHNIYNPEGDPTKDDFKVMSQKETADILKDITSIFTLLLSSIAAISLVVGGIGIMNIMLVSVTERTREIGLRKAVGATKKDILAQFLFEAVFLTLSGGILGIGLGAVFSLIGSIIFSQVLGAPLGFTLSLNAIAWGVGVSAAIGILFGIYPARQASIKNPIEALRYE